MRVIQGMYTNVRSRVRVNGQYSEEFGVGVGVHQGSVLSPLLFILVLEALSCEFRTGVPWELLYADDLAVIADTLEECVSKLKAWKEGMVNKGMKVNMKKTKLVPVISYTCTCFCLYVCICARRHVLTSSFMHACLQHISVCQTLCTYACVSMSVYMYVCLYVCLSICVFLPVCVSCLLMPYACLFFGTCTFVCTHADMYMYVLAHSCTHARLSATHISPSVLLYSGSINA